MADSHNNDQHIYDHDYSVDIMMILVMMVIRLTLMVKTDSAMSCC